MARTNDSTFTKTSKIGDRVEWTNVFTQKREYGEVIGIEWNANVSSNVASVLCDDGSYAYVAENKPVANDLPYTVYGPNP